MRAGKNGRIGSDCYNIYQDCPTATYTIPVVVHIVRNTKAGGDPFIADSAVHKTLKELNQYFAGTHPDQLIADPAFSSVYAGDTKIKFVLAAVDTAGLPHSGIIRIDTQIDSFMMLDPIDPYDATKYNGDDYEITTNPIPSVKRILDGGSKAWPHNKYLNIWVCDIADHVGDVASGFATLPKWDTYFPQFSGVVVEPSCFLQTPVMLDIHLISKPRSTLAHEIGHWLNLYHTFTDGCSGDCDYTAGDFCEDTPRENVMGWVGVCTGAANTCPEPGKDMDENIMNYTSCRMMFTKEQAARMQCALADRNGAFMDGNNCIAQLSSPKTNIPTGAIALARLGSFQQRSTLV